MPAISSGVNSRSPSWRIIPFSKWRITMVSFRPLSRVVGPLPNGRFMAPIGVILNYLRPSWFRPSSKYVRVINSLGFRGCPSKLSLYIIFIYLNNPNIGAISGKYTIHGSYGFGLIFQFFRPFRIGHHFLSPQMDRPIFSQVVDLCPPSVVATSGNTLPYLVLFFRWVSYLDVPGS